MNQLTEGLGQTATSVHEADSLAVTASGAAAKGGEVVSSIQAIDASAQKIADITSPIDGIAFQTNTLATSLY